MIKIFKISASSKEIKKSKAFMSNGAPFSFKYESNEFPKGFTPQNNGFYHNESCLLCGHEFKTYEESSVIEWTPRFENLGGKNSGIIEELYALDYTFPFENKNEVVKICYTKGTMAQIEDFSFNETWLGEDPAIFESNGSRNYLPFFNLDMGGGGIILGLGFTANWKAIFNKTERGVHVTVFTPRSHFYLAPGEHVRNIKILVMFWDGEKNRSYNMLRNHLVRNYIPCDENCEPTPPICCISWGGMKTENHLKYIDFIKKNKLNFDCYWIDAGWHGSNHETEEYQNFYTEDWAYNQGDWSINRKVHPNGLKPVSKAAHDAGMKLLLWFGTYCCNGGMGWYKNHPEWGTQNVSPHPIGKNPKLTTLHMLNMNIPEAKRYITDEICKTIAENNIDYYREDTPPVYGGNDEPNKTGYNEMKAVEALYDYWDELRSRFPGILIDNCGGGGSHIDLETISRSYVLWRSDYNCFPDSDPIGCQVGNYGLAHFVPLVGSAPPINPGSTYTFHSGIYGGMSFGLFHPCGFGEPEKHTWIQSGYPVEWHKKMLDTYRLAKPFLSGDFYPLTPCTVNTDDILSYQNDRPDMNEGLIFAFFRQNCVQNNLTVKPVLSEGEYEFTNTQTDNSFRQSVTKDFTLTLTSSEKPSSTLLHYKKL